jgi:group I intron endonuclease
MNPGIYAIHNIVSDKWYVGQSIDVFKRLTQHQKDLENKRHRNILLQKSWNHHGSRAFQFLILLQAREYSTKYLTEEEQYWMFFYGYPNRQKCYNLRDAGGLGRLSEEHRNKIAASSKGKVISADQRIKLSKANRGKNVGTHFSEEHRKKMSLAQRRRYGTL